MGAGSVPLDLLRYADGGSVVVDASNLHPGSVGRLAGGNPTPMRREWHGRCFIRWRNVGTRPNGDYLQPPRPATAEPFPGTASLGHAPSIHSPACFRSRQYHADRRKTARPWRNYMKKIFASVDILRRYPFLAVEVSRRRAVPQNGVMSLLPLNAQAFSQIRAALGSRHASFASGNSLEVSYHRAGAPGWRRPSSHSRGGGRRRDDNGRVD